MGVYGDLPSGKRVHNYGLSLNHGFQWENARCLWPFSIAI